MVPIKSPKGLDLPPPKKDAYRRKYASLFVGVLGVLVQGIFPHAYALIGLQYTATNALGLLVVDLVVPWDDYSNGTYQHANPLGIFLYDKANEFLCSGSRKSDGLQDCHVGVCRRSGVNVKPTQAVCYPVNNGTVLFWKESGESPAWAQERGIPTNPYGTMNAGVFIEVPTAHIANRIVPGSWRVADDGLTYFSQQMVVLADNPAMYNTFATAVIFALAIIHIRACVEAISDIGIVVKGSRGVLYEPPLTRWGRQWRLATDVLWFVISFASVAVCGGAVKWNATITLGGILGAVSSIKVVRSICELFSEVARLFAGHWARYPGSVVVAIASGLAYLTAIAAPSTFYEADGFMTPVEGLPAIMHTEGPHMRSLGVLGMVDAQPGLFIWGLAWGCSLLATIWCMHRLQMTQRLQITKVNSVLRAIETVHSETRVVTLLCGFGATTPCRYGDLVALLGEDTRMFLRAKAKGIRVHVTKNKCELDPNGEYDLGDMTESEWNALW